MRTLLWVIMIFGCMGAVAKQDSDAHPGDAAAINVRPEDLVVKPPANNWISYNGDYSGRRFSALSEINANNVDRLKAQWVFHTDNTRHLEVTPVVVNGLMFITAANEAYALDARTGREVWHHRRPISAEELPRGKTECIWRPTTRTCCASTRAPAT